MKVLIGNKTVIERLEFALEEAKAGRLVGVVICGICDGDGITSGSLGWDAAAREDAPFPWPRLVTAVATAHHELMLNGLEG